MSLRRWGMLGAGRWRWWTGGLLDADGDEIAPAARFGKHEGYLDAIALRLGDERVNRGPTARAIRGDAPVITNDIASDPGFFWKKEALSRGLRSCAVLPLRRRGRVIGVLAIHGESAGFFRAEESQVVQPPPPGAPGW